MAPSSMNGSGHQGGTGGSTASVGVSQDSTGGPAARGTRTPVINSQGEPGIHWRTSRQCHPGIHPVSVNVSNLFVCCLFPQNQNTSVASRRNRTGALFPPVCAGLQARYLRGSAERRRQFGRKHRHTRLLTRSEVPANPCGCAGKTENAKAVPLPVDGCEELTRSVRTHLRSASAP